MAGAGWGPGGSARAQTEMLDRDAMRVRLDQQPEVFSHGDATMPTTVATEGDRATLQEVATYLSNSKYKIRAISMLEN